MPQTLESSYHELAEWIDSGNCPHVPEGIDPFKKTVDHDSWEKCIQLWQKYDRLGSLYFNMLGFDKLRIRVIPIEYEGRDGPIYVRDIKAIDAHSGFLKSQSMDLESY